MIKARYIGVDFGSRFSGNTAVAYSDQSKIQIQSMKKGDDADLWLMEVVRQSRPSHVFIDAPLSLPRGFFDQSDQLMYRSCDRACKAMSPMFLGGLTARAIQFKRRCQELKIEVSEVYPSKLVDILSLRHYSKKAKAPDVELIDELITHGIAFDRSPRTMHEVDAALAWLSGKRYLKGEAISFGDRNEGCIYV